MSATHFKVNEKELDRLCRRLGLKYPVLVQGSALKRSHGRYHGLSRYTVKGKVLDRQYHQVTLSATTPIERLVETVIHECVHALQQERHGSTKYPANPVFNDEAKKLVAEMGGKRLTKYDRYWTKPIEVEARTVAKKLAPDFSNLLAVKPTKEYIVDERILVIGARSPQAAAAKVSQCRYGTSAYASHCRIRVRRDSDDVTGMGVIRWRPS